MIWIDKGLSDFVKGQVTKKWTSKTIKENFYKHQWQQNRSIRVLDANTDESIYYEISCRYVTLYIGNLDSHKYLVDYLEPKTDADERYEWNSFADSVSCRFQEEIDSWDKLTEVLDIVIPFFDKLMHDFKSIETTIKEEEIKVSNEEPTFASSVDLDIKRLEDVFKLNLKIPDYQRIYCWGEDNVKCLLDDLVGHNVRYGEVPYRLGTIILHYHDNRYDIIDGQQRLVTLSLILHQLGITTCLMGEKLSSSEAYQYVAYNKNVISNYIAKHIAKHASFVQTLLSQIEFSVLVLKNASLDLAYTFFSNENSRGVMLTDYDLLKVHHLRYIPKNFELQSQKAAETWNDMIEQGIIDKDNHSLPDYERTLDTFIFYLRQWMRKQEVHIAPNDHHVKKEYEAAAIMAEIPPFGERFYFNEPIQGGTHFFTFVELQRAKYHQLGNTEVYRLIHSHFSDYGSFLWYRDVAEAILFAYYQKFGEQCIADVAVLILRILLQHRYDTSRALRDSISSYISNLGIVLMIDQATSPTFFIAEAFNLCRDFPLKYLREMTPIQKRMRACVTQIKNEMSDYIFVESIKNIKL